MNTETAATPSMAVGELRDTKGRFIKGHTSIVTPPKPGNKGGRPKGIKGQMRDALALAEDAMPDILKTMIERSQDKEDRDCQRAGEYLMDRVYGKARQGLDIDHDIGITLRVVYPQERIEHVGIIDVTEHSGE